MIPASQADTADTTDVPGDESSANPDTAKPVPARRLQFDPGRQGLRALVAVVIVVATIAAVVAWQTRPVLEPVPVAGTPAASQSSAAELVVAVAGQVRRPGLVRLPAGARVADAIDKAGGALPGADLSALNLARRVVDGEKIVVGAPPSSPGSGPKETSGNGKVNLNLATVAELDALPGVGPVLAKRIVEYREKHGGFRSVEQLRKVDGIGATRYERLKELVTV